MFVSYKINSLLMDPISGSTINIPINLEYQIVDNAELIESLFVKTETQKSVNPILDYDKVRFTPVDINGVSLGNINYNLFFLNANNNIATPTYYSDIGFEDADIRYLRNYFTESYLYLAFYDTDNAMTQNLVTEIEIYNRLSKGDYYPSGATRPNIAGQPKPASQIPTNLILSNPLIVEKGFYEGYYIYNYKDDLVVNGLPKYLYMKASYFNAKTGKIVNLTTEPSATKIDVLVNKLYTRFELYRDTTGFYYKISDTYSQNVSFAQNATNQNNKDVTIKLYQIQAL